MEDNEFKLDFHFDISRDVWFQDILFVNNEEQNVSSYEHIQDVRHLQEKLISVATR